jgi:hypothetical protein
LAAAFVAMILLVGNVAQACPKHQNTLHPIKIEWSAPAPAAVLSVASHVTKASVPSDGPCCGAGCHSHEIGCSGGCCSIGGIAIDAAGWAFVLPSASINIAIRNQGEVASLEPPPNYRPPRTL